MKENKHLTAYFQEIQGCLVESGKYSVATIEVSNSFQKNEIFKLIKPSETIKEAVYKQATRSINMDERFVDMCLERPKKPSKGCSQKEWDLYANWNKISENKKIEVQLEKLAHDMGCELVGFNLQ